MNLYVVVDQRLDQVFLLGVYVDLAAARQVAGEQFTVHQTDYYPGSCAHLGEFREENPLEDSIVIPPLGGPPK